MDSVTLRAPLHTLEPKVPVCVTKGTKISDVIGIMKDNRIGCVCIVEDDLLIGIFTERDVLSKVIGSSLDTDETFVEDLMTNDPEYLYDDDQIAFALNRMHVGGFRHIPLIDLAGRPTGIISVRDILAYMTRSLAENN